MTSSADWRKNKNIIDIDNSIAAADFNSLANVT